MEERATGSYLADRKKEQQRLLEQERVFSRTLGLLPGVDDQDAFLAPLSRVLDVACGSGGWALALASRYPHLQVQGFDIDADMIAFANEHARSRGLSNATFKVMDATEPLAFADDSFDLVNARYLIAIGVTAWPATFPELVRITRPGGFVRLTEQEDNSVTSSPALEELTLLILQAFHQGGYLLSPTGRTNGVTPWLEPFLRQAGCQQIRKTPLLIDWSAGQEEHDTVALNLKTFYRQLEPLLLGYGGQSRERLDHLYQQMEKEMAAEDFCALWYFLTVIGQKPL